jgi:hypothetical protein
MMAECIDRFFEGAFKEETTQKYCGVCEKVTKHTTIETIEEPKWKCGECGAVGAEYGL